MRPLFRRQNRRLVLSDQGRVLLSYADRLLRLSAEAQQAVRDGARAARCAWAPWKARRRPGCRRCWRPTTRPGRRCASSWSRAPRPRWRPRCATTNSKRPSWPSPFPAEGLASTEAFAETLVLISPRAWPEIADARALADHTVIAFASGCSYRRILESWLGREGVAPGKVMEFASYHAIVACVAAGTGVAIVPRSVLDVLGGQTALRVRDLPGKYGAARTRLVWRVDDDTPAVQALRDQLAA